MKRLLLGMAMTGALVAPAFPEDDDDALAACAARYAGRAPEAEVAQYCADMAARAAKAEAMRAQGYRARCYDYGGAPRPPGYRGRWLGGHCRWTKPDQSD